MKKLKNKIDKYEYVSFDIFDTLIKRNVLDPLDIFDIVQVLYNESHDETIENFRHNRILAQKKVYQNSIKEEINIYDIYNELSTFYSKKICNELLKLEQQTEINMCVLNKTIYDVYQYCLNKNKKIIITSDMYLDIDTIKKILDNCNISGYKHLYLSSEYNKRKSTGNIYPYILKDLNITSKNIIHIGDNFLSDYIIPKKFHITSYLVTKEKYNNFYNKRVDKSNINNYNILENFISNNMDINTSYYYKFGYECFGPILYGFTCWLRENLKDKNIFFLSRDGYLMQKAFNIVNKECNSKYFYASRRALIIPTLWMDTSLKQMLDKLYVRDYIKIANLFRKLGLEERQYEDVILKYGFKLDQKIGYNDLFEDKQFLSLFNELKPIIYKNSKREYNILLKYMKQENFIGDVGIVDIGWNGNMQLALSKILKNENSNTKISGYYIGILPESKNLDSLNLNAYLFNNEKNKDIYITLKVINSIFESMFLAPHGSVKKYVERNKKIEPILLDYEYNEGKEKNAYQDIQNGALKFVSDFCDSYLSKILDINHRLSFYSMSKFAYYPTKEDILMFGDFCFLEDDLIYLAKPRPMRYYIFHPKIFFSDLYTSGWIIAFMIRLTKVNFFYSHIYRFGINIYLKKYLNR